MKRSDSMRKHGRTTREKSVTGLKVKSNIRAGYISLNHNKAVASEKASAGVKVKSHVRAGYITLNHNRAVAR